MSKGKGRSKTPSAPVKEMPKRAPFRKTCTTCGASWLGDLIYDCGHGTVIEQDI